MNKNTCLSKLLFFLHVLLTAGPLLLGGHYCGLCFYTKENTGGFSYKLSHSGSLLSNRQLKKPQSCLLLPVFIISIFSLSWQWYTALFKTEKLISFYGRGRRECFTLESNTLTIKLKVYMQWSTMYKEIKWRLPSISIITNWEFCAVLKMFKCLF